MQKSNIIRGNFTITPFSIPVIYIKKALSEYTEDCFDYRRSNVDELLNVCEKAANLLECCDMIPMAYPPTAKINRYRAMENPPLDEIRVLAFELAKTLKEICQIL